MKKLFFLALIFCFHSTICLADMCTAMPSCTELGYYRGTNIACGDDDSRYITCPYDPDYRKCVNYDCEEMGFVKDGLEQLLTWCQNIIFCKKDKSYVLCGDIDGPNTVCVPVYCAGVTPPSNAYGTTSCTPQDVDCEYGDQVYTAWSCIGGYHKTDDETACEADCIPTTCSGGMTVPTNAHSTATCAPRYSNCKFGDEVVTAWACDQGYHTNAAGTGCDPDCEEITCGAAVSVPANAHSTGQCTPRAGNCSQGSTIDTGWACNQGYHEKNGACEADCTVVSCGAAISSKPANASYTTCTTRDKNCNTTTVNVDWVCNTNFHKNSAGTACEADCPVVTCGAAISSKPANSSYTTCTATDKNCNTNTVNTGWACVSGYHEKNDACEADCSVVTCGAAVTLPANAHCTNNCTPRDKNCNNTGEARCTAWDCDSGYKKNSAGTGCELGCAVQTCGSAISSKPANSDYITCTTMDQDCNTNTINVDWECKSGYHKNSAGTGCDKDCTVVTCGAAISSKPANSEYITCTRRNTSCNTSKVNVDWACVSGYHKNSAGTGCDVDCSTNDCATIIIPANANGTGSCTPRYSDCSYGSSKFTGWECKSGYHKNSAQTGCDKDCTVKNCDPGVSVPNNAYGTTSCTPKDKNCNDGSIVYYAWECNSGYHKNSAGTGCDKDATCTVVTCTASTPPSHAHGTSPCTPVHSDCTTDPAVNTSWECDSGYEKCSSTCQSKAEGPNKPAAQETQTVQTQETSNDTVSCDPLSQTCGCGGTQTKSCTKTRTGTRTKTQKQKRTRDVTWNVCSQSWSTGIWSSWSNDGDPTYSSWSYTYGNPTYASNWSPCTKSSCTSPQVCVNGECVDDCSQYTTSNGWYTTAPTGCYDKGEEKTCGGQKYTKYTAMDTTCCGESMTLYNSSRKVAVVLKAEWDSSQCKCVDKAKIGSSTTFTAVTSCTNAGGLHTHTSGQQSNCYIGEYHCGKTGLWCDGYLSETEWIGSDGGQCASGSRWSETDCKCMPYGATCDNSKGYYTSCPTGASCTTENGCQKPTGCGSGYGKSGTTTPFSLSSTGVSFYVGTTYTTCYPVSGCNSGYYGSVSSSTSATNIGNTVFTATTVTSGSVSCKYATGCMTDKGYYPSGYSGCTLNSSGPTAGTGSTIRKCYTCKTSSTTTCDSKYQGTAEFTYNGTKYCGGLTNNTYMDELCCKSTYLTNCRNMQNSSPQSSSCPFNSSWLKDNCFSAQISGYWYILINN